MRGPMVTAAEQGKYVDAYRLIEQVSGATPSQTRIVGMEYTGTSESYRHERSMAALEATQRSLPAGWSAKLEPITRPFSEHDDLSRMSVRGGKVSDVEIGVRLVAERAMADISA